MSEGRCMVLCYDHLELSCVLVTDLFEKIAGLRNETVAVGFSLLCLELRPGERASGRTGGDCAIELRPSALHVQEYSRTTPT